MIGIEIDGDAYLKRGQASGTCDTAGKLSLAGGCRYGGKFVGSSLTDASYILLQQINRGGQQDNILHQERDVAGHRGKSGNRIPAVGHERNDRDRGEESHGRIGGAENAEPLVPEACEQQRTEGPLGDAQEPAGALQGKCGIKPPDQWTVADERNGILSNRKRSVILVSRALQARSE